MKTLKTLFAISFFFTFLFSCTTMKKRLYMPGYYIEWADLKRTTPHKYTGSLNYSVNVYDALSVKPIQETCIPVSLPGTVHGKEGTRIEFPADAFTYENGKPVKCDKVCVRTWEFYSMADIIASGLSTTSGKRMLVSGGMVYVEATCCGEKLKLKTGKRITVKMPAGDADARMKLFAGKLQNGIVDWKAQGKVILENTYPAPDTTAYEVEREYGDGEYIPERDGRGQVLDGYYEGEGGDPTYIMKSGSLGWINCDRFYDIEKKTTLAVKADTSKKTYIALVFKEIKSVMPGYYNQKNVAEFSGIPDGEEVIVLAYRVDEKTKTAVVGRRDITLGDVQDVELEMEEMSIESFKELLAGFN